MLTGYAAIRFAQDNLATADLEAISVPIGGVKIILDETTGDMLPSQRQLDRMVAEIHRLGVTVAAGSDCPVVPPAPLIGICAAITRRSETGEVIAPHEKISLIEALALHTSHAATTVGAAWSTGFLLPGYSADIVVLNGNLTDMSHDSIRDLEVGMTILHGEIVWQKAS